MLASRLKKILADKVVVSSTSGVVVLKEQRVQKVEVSKLASDAVVVKLDRVGELSGLGKGPWKQVCIVTTFVGQRFGFNQLWNS